MRFIIHDENGCADCPYAKSRTFIVRDEIGDDYSGIMLVGEAPGYNEDKAARPFVGDSGQVLDRFLELAGLSRSQLYITNTVRCRPPGNKLTAKPLRFHRPFLDAAVAYAKPHTILAVGATALSAFAPDKRKLTACHGKPFLVDLPHGQVKVVPLFHPAFAMRNDKIWRPLYHDFQTLMREPPAPIETHYRLGTDHEAATFAKTFKRIGFDIETTDTLHEGIFYPHLQRCLGYSVSIHPGLALYVPEPPGPEMSTILKDSSVVKVCHNAKFEYTALKNHGIEMVGFEDTKLKAYLLGYLSTRLKDLTWQVLDVQQMRLEDVLKGRSTSELTAEEWLPYAAADADLTLRLDDVLDEELRAEGLRELYEQFELPLVPILAEAERRGVMLDTAQFGRLADQLRARRTELEVDLKLALGDINLNSGPQKAKVLFGEWKLPVVKKTPGKKPSLDKEAVELLLKHEKVKDERKEVLRKLHEYTQLGDYLGDFVEKLPRIAVPTQRDADSSKEAVDARGAGVDDKLFPDQELPRIAVGAGRVGQAGVPSDGVVDGQVYGEVRTLHTSLNQAGTWEDTGGAGKESPSTGRLSSSNPNLMQIPKRDAKLAAEVRKGFMARPGFALVSADIQQEEPRLFAVAANDENMRAVFARGDDIYMPIAHILKRMFTGDADAVAGPKERDAWGLEYRDSAKNKVFLPVSYGAGARKLASVHPGLTESKAGGIIRGLRELYPGLVNHSKVVEAELMKLGYAMTHFGRKRWLPGVWYYKQRAEAVRMAVNMYPQGTGADVLKGTVIRLNEELVALGARFLFPVHDELVYEVPEDRLAEALPIIHNMTAWFEPIELPVEVKVGRNWAEMEKR